MGSLQLREVDKLIYRNEIRPYLPARIFDAHSHIYLKRYNTALKSLDDSNNPLLKNVDVSDLMDWWKTLFADSKISGLILGFPTRNCNIMAINTHLSNHVAPPNIFSILCSPEISEKELEASIIQLQPAGLKPYMCFAKRKDFGSASIFEMIPEYQIALAHKYGLAVTLHVAKSRGMADPQNLSDIKRLVKQYPHCNFILAHCGRCFISPNAEEMLKFLPVADNLWIDTSAVCDTGVFLNILSKYEKKRIIFGTDLATATGFRGTYVRMGTSWNAITDDKITGSKLLPDATFAAYENLCAFLSAARFCKLTESNLNDIFYENASALFKLPL